MTDVSVTKKGQITIPIAVRKKFGIEEGTKVAVKIVEGKIIIEKAISIMDLAGTGQSKAEVVAVKETLNKMREEDA